MSDTEAELIMRTLAENLQTYDQVTEVCDAMVHANSKIPIQVVSFYHYYPHTRTGCCLLALDFSTNRR